MLGLILRGISKVLGALPLRGALRFGRGLGWIYGSVIGYHREEALEALARVFPDQTEHERKEILKKVYAHLGMNIVETIRLAAGRDEQLDTMEVRGLEHAEEARAVGKGIMILTAHCGNWDLLSVKTPRLGFPLTIISKDLKQGGVNDFWMEMRDRYELNIVPVKNSYRKCIKALRSGGLIGFMIDQNMINTEGLFVNFFGKPACTTPGLAFMAAHSKAPILPVFTWRDPDDPTKHIMEALPMIEPPESRDEEALKAATQQYSDIVAEHILKHPEQWTWIHRRWRTVPENETKQPSI